MENHSHIFGRAGKHCCVLYLVLKQSLKVRICSLGSGHAALTLREDWRNQVRMARKDLGLEMVRFHGLLDDDMSISLSRGVHSWLNLDSTIDFLVGQGMRSVIELSFMPNWLANRTTTSGMQVRYISTVSHLDPTIVA